MTNQHLSREQIERYRDRTLGPGELSAVDTHLGRCSECRDQLAQATPASAAVSLISAVSDARSEHLTYEQMDAWVEDALDQTERELISAHIGLCGFCAQQLRSYEQAAPAMSAPVHQTAIQAAIQPAVQSAIQPAQPVQIGWMEKLRAFLFTPQTAIALAALLAIAIVAPYLATQNGAGGGTASVKNPAKPGEETLDLSLDSLPEALRNPARSMLTDEQPEVPAVLANLPATSGAEVVSPRFESLEEAAPLLRWMAFAPSYAVTLRNQDQSIVSRWEDITQTEFQVPVALVRGASYVWEVTGNGRTETAGFRVLDVSEAALLVTVRSVEPTSHLLIGLADQQFGLLSSAEQEFGILVRENPSSPAAQRLLRNVKALRTR